MFFPSHRHNAAVQRADQLLPWRTNVLPIPSRTHPWQVAPAWISKKSTPAGGYWAAAIEPGLVNGLPASVKIMFKDAPVEAQLRISADQTSAKKPKIKDDQTVEVFLDERPQLPLNWRRIGTGAAGTPVEQDGELVIQQEPVPEFFKRLGVKDASTNPLGYEATPTQGVRYLAASDLVLNQPRVAVQSEVTVGAAIDGTITSVQPTYAVPPDRQPRIVSFSKFDPPPPPTLSPRDLFFAPFQELPLDQLHLSTIYALSPFNPSSEDINGNWTTYFQYKVHWNLVYASRIAEAIRVQPLTLFTGLAAGIGDTLFNFILANNNDFSQAAANLITANNQGGRFHTV